jgi:hypothetical protein
MGFLMHLIIHEIYVWLPRISHWLAKRAARLLPANERERQLFAWLGDLNDMPNSLITVVFALNMFRAAATLRLEAMQASVPELRSLLTAKFRLWYLTEAIHFLLKIRLWRWRYQFFMLTLPIPRWESDKKKFRRLLGRVTATTLAGTRIMNTGRELALIGKCEACINLALSFQGTKTHPTWWAGLAEDRTGLQEVRARLMDNRKGWIANVDELRGELSGIRDEIRLRGLAAAGYRSLPGRWCSDRLPA